MVMLSDNTPGCNMVRISPRKPWIERVGDRNSPISSLRPHKAMIRRSGLHSQSVMAVLAGQERQHKGKYHEAKKLRLCHRVQPFRVLFDKPQPFATEAHSQGHLALSSKLDHKSATASPPSMLANGFLGRNTSITTTCSYFLFRQMCNSL